MKSLRGSVGRNGNNYKKEVVRIQAMLNVIPESLGGPSPVLKLDDIVGPKTIGAIEKFQQAQFGKKDGRVDRDGHTVKRLAELEDSDEIRPVQLRAASAALAAKWCAAGLAVASDALGPDGNPKPENQVSENTRTLITHFFSLQWSAPPDSSLFRKQVNAADLGFIRDKLTKMLASLKLPGFYTHLEPEEMYNDLTKPASIAMCGGTSLGPTVNFTFCEPDPVNKIGGDLNIRASALLQSSAFAGDLQDRGFGVSSFEWIMSGMVMPATALHMSDCYLLFCEMAANLPAFYFVQDTAGQYSAQTRPRR